MQTDDSAFDGRTVDISGIGVKDFVLASVAGVVVAGVGWIWGIPGLDPSMWHDIAVAAGVIPPQTAASAFWRMLTGWMFSSVGVSGSLRVLAVLGVVFGGVCAALVCIVVKQVLALLILSARTRSALEDRIASFFSFASAILFGLSDPFARIARILSPSLLWMVAALAVVGLSLRWSAVGGNWRLYSLVVVSGLLAAETPLAFLLPVVLAAAYLCVWRGVLGELFEKPENLPEPDEIPKWSMFHLFVGAFLLAVFLNVREFISLGGAAANGWDGGDAYFRYLVGYFRLFIGSASLFGWALGLGLCALPLIVALKLFPMVTRDDRPMPFSLGVLFLIVGVVAVMQCGAFPAARFWTLSKGIASVDSDLLLAFFVLCALVTLALSGAAFTLESQRDVDRGEDEEPVRRGLPMRCLVPALMLAIVVLACRAAPRPVEAEMCRVVDDAVREIVDECGDARYLFTDGRLDAAVELCAKERRRPLYTLSMMSGASAWEQSVRARPFAADTDDWRSAQSGAPALLRVWAGERPNGMDGVALQLGFELWKRERKPLPTLSGLVAREKGMDAKSAEDGVARCRALADRILALAPRMGDATPSHALSAAFFAVSCRLSRFARLRGDAELADALDRSNRALRRPVALIEQERQRTFMQMTPREGLQIALKRANFAEAQRHAFAVLRSNKNDAEANFALGMAALADGRYADAERYLSRCLEARPDEPATLNNLSIICRKLRRYDEAEAYARRALKVLPDSPEVKATLADALNKAP